MEGARRIGAAVGIVMCRQLLRGDEAFEVFQTISWNTNRRLRDVADVMVATGVIPDGSP